MEVLGERDAGRRRAGAAAGRGAGRGAGGVPAPVRAPQPRALRRDGSGRRPRPRRGRVAEALERVGLAAVDDRPVRAYSLGMRQRLGLAGALLRQPRLLVLDEPTNGLDPQGIHEIRELLLDLNAAGTTVFLSSHLLAEIEQMCTRVGVLDRGRLVLQDELAELQQPTGRVEVRTPDVAAGARAARRRGRAVRRGAAAGPRRRPGRRSTRGWCGPASGSPMLAPERHTPRGCRAGRDRAPARTGSERS